MPLDAQRIHDVPDDLLAAIEYCYQQGWTDGLPVVPPVVERVEAMRLYEGRPGEAVIATHPATGLQLTVHAAAVNAVMAGCLPEYFPVTVAIVRAMCQPDYALHGSTASTGGSAPFIVVNGPIRQKIGMNCTHNALGNGSRANATIGRSVRLMMLNVLGGFPGQLDRSTLGHPGKFTFCVAEDEEDSIWLPLSVERGIPAGTSAVTALQVQSPHQIMNEWTHDPKEILDTYASAMRNNMLTYSIWEGNYAFVIPKQHREIFGAAGWTKQDIREYVFEVARVKRGDWRSVGKAAVAGRKDEERVYRALRSPDDLLVVAAGGPAGGFGSIVPPWYGKKSLAVTAAIQD